MATEIEYELTFLAKKIPDEIKGVNGIPMHDIMVPDTVPHPHLRLRHQGDSYVITKKVPVQSGDSTEMIEETIPLEEVEFEALAKSSTKDVIKTRYKVDIGGYPAEVDVFGGKLKGLVLIDFEFSSNEQKEKFIMPDVCLANVSNLEFIAGGFIAGKSFEDIEHELDKFGYKRLGE